MRKAIQRGEEILTSLSLCFLLLYGCPLRADESDRLGGNKESIVVAGRCVNEKGEPLSVAAVRLFRFESEGTNRFDPPELLCELNCSDDGSFGPITVPASTNEYGQTNLAVVATLANHASKVILLDNRIEVKELRLELDSNPGALVGFVRSPNGKPVVDAVVYLPMRFAPIVGIHAARTDTNGKYRIGDLSRIQKTNTHFSLLVAHMDFANTRTEFDSVPSIVNVLLAAPAIVEGQVVDRVTGKAVAQALVSAQGVTDRGWFQTRSDASGNYRLMMTADRYNIWAAMKDRIPIAVDSINAISGQTATGANIELVEGAVVQGHYIDAATGKPIENAGDLRVAHYGPARPQSGAAVTSTKLQPDGSFQIRVAPGKNYLYVMGAGCSAWTDVNDGQEVKLNLVSGRSAAIVDNRGEIKAVPRQPPFQPSRARGDTPVARLLDRLERQNAGDDR